MLPFAWWNPALGAALGDQVVTTSETILILDRVILTQTSRISIKTAREFLELSEEISLDKAFLVSENLLILDRVILDQTSRLRVKTAR